MQPEQIRTELEKRLRRRVPQGTWDYVVKKFYVDEVMEEGDYTIEALVNEVRDIWAAAPSALGGGQRASKPSVDPRVSTAAETAGALDPVLERRAKALSTLIAAIADRDPAVLEFREEHLSGTPLAIADLDDWLDTRWQAEMQSILETGSFDPRTQTVILSYLTPSTSGELEPGELGPGEMVVPIGGSLEELGALADQLSGVYGWDAAQATTFILTGEPPAFFPVRVSRFDRVDEPISAGSRITLEIDPMVTPRQLARAWNWMRSALIEPNTRTLSQHHMELAEFTARRDGEPWMQIMMAWNQLHPDHAYLHRSNFTRDALAAKRKLLSIPFTWA